MPDGDSIRGSKTEGLIKELIMSGWTPHRIYKWLGENHPESSFLPILKPPRKHTAYVVGYTYLPPLAPSV